MTFEAVLDRDSPHVSQLDHALGTAAACALRTATRPPRRWQRWLM
jgi:hypothetical protein